MALSADVDARSNKWVENSMANSIEKTIKLDVPIEKAWFTLTDTAQFAQWASMQFKESFAVGKTLQGSVLHDEYTDVTVEIEVVALDEPTLFSYIWHPHALDSSYDYSTEPKTRVDFRLAPVDGGSSLTVTETGFDFLHADRIEESYEAHVGGWDFFMGSFAEVATK